MKTTSLPPLFRRERTRWRRVREWRRHSVSWIELCYLGQLRLNREDITIIFTREMWMKRKSPSLIFRREHTRGRCVRDRRRPRVQALSFHLPIGLALDGAARWSHHTAVHHHGTRRLFILLGREQDNVDLGHEDAAQCNCSTYNKTQTQQRLLNLLKRMTWLMLRIQRSKYFWLE